MSGHPEAIESEDPELPEYPKPDNSCSASRAKSSAVGKASRPGMDAFLCMHRADDDTTIKLQPTRQVDYLSYNWKRRIYGYRGNTSYPSNWNTVTVGDWKMLFGERGRKRRIS
ncbi:hypothetical protein V2G26_018275 [Clonostachys chloroleuca]